jgi:hypothetical protein
VPQDLGGIVVDPAREPGFFSATGGPAVGRQQANPRTVAAALNRTLCDLVTRGHSQVLTYPWSMYLAAIEVANKAQG